MALAESPSHVPPAYMKMGLGLVDCTPTKRVLDSLVIHNVPSTNLQVIVWPAMLQVKVAPALGYFFSKASCERAGGTSHSSACCFTTSAGRSTPRSTSAAAAEGAGLGLEVFGLKTSSKFFNLMRQSGS